MSGLDWWGDCGACGVRRVIDKAGRCIECVQKGRPVQRKAGLSRPLSHCPGFHSAGQGGTPPLVAGGGGA